MPEREEGSPRSQQEEEEEGAPPEQRTLSAHSMQGPGGGQTLTNIQRVPPEQHALPAHGVQGGGGEDGAGPQPDREGGAPPKQARTPFVRGLNQEMGVNPQDL